MAKNQDQTTHERAAQPSGLERRRRQAEALRKNLLRRKAQARGRGEARPPSEPPHREDD